MKTSSGAKQKPRYLDDHVEHFRDLTWAEAELLYDYYKPATIPTFECKRVGSITADTVLLFQKIIDLLPKTSDPRKLVEDQGPKNW